ncbi:unnamed protein product [Sphagnum troendelagicum]|uniref:Uncharacterized protein n=1 Tax=Sphagnum troendelagicum TaxID=128251 RepID=A0ABP0T8D1_9BRYO
MPSAMLDSEKQGIPFEELLAIPERDDWEYGNGYSTCVAFILQMYKEAGLFGSLSSSIQVTEFRIRDAYMLNFFEDDASGCQAGAMQQIHLFHFARFLRVPNGATRVQHPNSIYAHMDEACPTLPPAYTRPENCRFNQVHL